jgi:hypothetical protein
MTRFRPLKRGVSYLFPSALYKGEVILGKSPKTKENQGFPGPQAQKVLDEYPGIRKAAV